MKVRVKFLFIRRERDGEIACNFRITAMGRDLFLDLYREDKVGYSLIGLIQTS